MGVRPSLLTEMAQAAGAEIVVVDDLRLMSLYRNGYRAAAAYDQARQHALAGGVDLLELFHSTGRSGEGRTAFTAGSGTVVELAHGEADAVGLRAQRAPMHRIAEWVVVKLRDHGPMTLGELRRAARSTDRELVSDAVSQLWGEGVLSPSGPGIGRQTWALVIA